MLKTDYKDDILNTDVNVNRKFNIVRSNGTVVEQNVELRETTAFKQEGDSFGAKDINETNEAIVDVQTKLQNLQVGGRNLIEDSKGEFSGEYPNSGYTSLGARFANLPAYATQFVLSFEAKSTVAGDKINSYFYSPSDIIKTEGSNGFISYANDGGIEYTLTTNWTRYWVKWTAPVAERRTLLPCRLMSGKGTGTVSIRNIKFEVGTLPTDWTPAPEDITDTPITSSEIDTILNS